MGRELLFDLRDVEERRAAVVEDGRLAELAVESDGGGARRGDVFLGRVTRVEPSVGAAFVDLGLDKPAFLHADDVMPLYADDPEDLTAFAARPRGPAGDIGALLRPGQRVLVQATRESVGQKGPAVTTYLSLPGRWLVLMPSLERVGVSRRVTDPASRDRARAALAALEPPPGMGFIVRTAGVERGPEELREDYEALLARFRAISDRVRGCSAPTVLHREDGLLHRTLRDWLAADVDAVRVDGREGWEEAREFLARAAPGRLDRLHLHGAEEPLFHASGIEQSVERLFERRVPLPGGAFLLVEPTEALISIDVNSGRAARAADLEETALRTDLAAAAEVARQVRLRDLGGVIVIDFIDVRRPENRRAVDDAVAEAFREDRARVRIAPMSEFGLVQITRRRTGRSLRQLLHDGCPACGGKGVVRTPASGALRALREARALAARGASGLSFRAAPAVEAWLRQHRAAEIARLDRLLPEGFTLRADGSVPPGGFHPG